MAMQVKDVSVFYPFFKVVMLLDNTSFVPEHVPGLF